MVFEIGAPSSSFNLVLVVLAAVALLPALFLGWVALTSKDLAVVLEPEGLRIDAPLYGRTIAYDALDLDRTRVERLTDDSPLRPKIRTNGIALPGYRVGWYRLHSDEKALLALTKSERAVYVPTRQGYALLLGPQDPERLVEELRARR